MLENVPHSSGTLFKCGKAQIGAAQVVLQFLVELTLKKVMVEGCFYISIYTILGVIGPLKSDLQVGKQIDIGNFIVQNLSDPCYMLFQINRTNLLEVNLRNRVLDNFTHPQTITSK